MSAKLIRRWLCVLCVVAFAISAADARAQQDPCAMTRAVIAGETALRNALAHSTANAAPLRAAIAQITEKLGPRPVPALTSYLASRTEIAATLISDGVLVARQLARDTPHVDIGQVTLMRLNEKGDCGAAAQDANATDGERAEAGTQISGGHGGVPTPGVESATGSGQASQPGGKGMATAPLSFLRDFNAQWHVIPAVGATLAFGALIFSLSRNRRQHRRYLCHLPINIQTRDGVASHAILLDISQGGGKIVRSGNWDVGTRLKVQFDKTDDPVPARVVWANKGFVGLTFGKALTLTELGLVLKRAKAGAGAALKDGS